VIDRAMALLETDTKRAASLLNATSPDLDANPRQRL